MTNDTTCTPDAPRAGPADRRGDLRDAAALAPAASAQTGPNEPLGGLPQTPAQTVQALPHTLSDPLGGPDAPGAGDVCEDVVDRSVSVGAAVDRRAPA